MSEEITQNVPSDGRSFEERVFARFDAMDARFNAIDARFDMTDARLQRLEDESERRTLETKPTWERALAEILELRRDVGEVKDSLRDLSRKINVLNRDMIQLRADHDHVEDQVEKLESKLPT